MNTLNSYNPNDQLNQAILVWLPAGRPGGEREHLYLGDEDRLGLTTKNLTLLSSKQYPFTALGTIGLVKLTDQPQPQVVQQILNRHTVPQTNQSVDQLVLLDLTARVEIEAALRQDAAHTRGTKITHPLFDSPDPDVQWILANPGPTFSMLSAIRQSGFVPQEAWAQEAYSHFRPLQFGEPIVLERVRAWVYNWTRDNVRLGWDRFLRNDVKSGTRLSGHYTNLSADLGSKQARTAARGEYAASKLLITTRSPDYQMKMGKSAGGGRPNGIDQIWVRRDMQTGDVLEYLIIEAKGSVKAHMGHTSTGEQMSPRWLFWCLVQMAHGNRSYIDAQTKPQLPQKILTALINPGGIPVRGVIFHSLHASDNESKVVAMTNLGFYKFVDAYTNAKRGDKPFTNALQVPYEAFQ